MEKEEAEALQMKSAEAAHPQKPPKQNSFKQKLQKKKKKKEQENKMDLKCKETLVRINGSWLLNESYLGSWYKIKFCCMRTGVGPVGLWTMNKKRGQIFVCACLSVYHAF